MALFSSFTISYSKRWWLGVFVSMSLLFAGFINTPNSSFNEEFFDQECFFKAFVSDVTKNTSEKQSLILRCCVNDNQQEFCFSALAYLKKDSLFQDLKPGDQIAFKTTLTALSYTGNPYAFEYANYMHIRDIKGQVFLKSNEFIRLPSIYTYQRFFYIVKVWAEQKLRNLNLDEEEFGIVSALVLGDKSFLAYNTKVNFSNSGAIHVLSVSGLHVGVLYLLLVFLFGKTGKGWFSSVKVILMLMVLWFYASITGMSPSVFRSTVMFTVFLIARWKNQYYNIYHSLAIAAFIIVVVNPYSVVNAGFWLSFFAVSSIVYFYPKIFNLFYFRSPWGKYVWALVSVSLAAQIGTFPLCIYLFGIFPTWFLISNLFIIPILPFVLIGSLIVIILPFNSLPVELIQGVLRTFILFMSDATHWIAHLPYNKFIKLQLVFFEMVFIYISLIYFVIWKQFKSGKYLVGALSFLLLSCLLISYKSWVRSQEVIFTVHQVKGKTAISYTAKESSYYLINDSLSTKDINQSIYPLWLTQETISTKQISLKKYLLYPVTDAQNLILVINGNLPLIKNISEIKEVRTFVVTSSLSLAEIKILANGLRDATVVFDSSFSVFKSKLIKEELKDLPLFIHFVSLDGAYVAWL